MITNDLVVPAVNSKNRFFTSKTDRVFKTIFVRDNDFHLMEALLSECLETKVKVVKYLYPELKVKDVFDKEKKVDVLIEADNKNILVELNTEGLGIRIRNFNYFTNFYSTRIKRGSDYFDDKEHILIDFSYNIGNIYPIKNVYYIQNESGEKYVKNFKIIEFNMDKIRKECYDEIVKGVSEQYKYLCMLNLDKEKLEKISHKDSIVKEYMDRLVELNRDEEFRYVVSAEEDAKLTQKLLEDYARDEGLKEGRNLEKIEMAKNMIIKKYSIDDIIEITGLSKKEIEKLK